MILCIDDLSAVTQKELSVLDELKAAIPQFKCTAFVITSHHGKQIDANFISECKSRPWMEIGLHAYEHSYPPDPERDDYEEIISTAFEILKPLSPKCYRPAGFQHTIRTMPLMEKLRIERVVHQDCIQIVKSRKKLPVILGNSHFDSYCSDYIGKIAPILKAKWRGDKFFTVSEVEVPDNLCEIMSQYES